MSPSETHQVIARKFRPSQFDELIGQEHISKTLQNAIRSGRIAHAYLFAGPRGVGKTTTSRLLAKSLNCDKGATPYPCEECQYCREIKNGNSMLVMEIDGASNNGVDQVRSITDLLQYNIPDQKYKIIIIDEVHMLTTPAFNALLKSLEEPPARVIFIFATTELHKVPDTIQSRCQVHLFQLIALAEIVKRLEKVCQKENIKADSKVFPLLSRFSGGSMRDAETLLEKVISFCGAELKEDEVSRCLGIAPRDEFYKLTQCIYEENKKEAFLIVQSVFNNGFNVSKWISQNIEWYRTLLFYKISPDLMTDLELTEDEQAAARELSSHFNETELVYIIDQWTEMENQLRFAVSPRTLIEMGVIKLCRSKHIIPVDVVIRRLYALESRIKGHMEHKNQVPTEAQEPQPELTGVKKNSEPSLPNESRWQDFLKVLESHHKILHSHLKQARVKYISDKVIELYFDLSSVFDYKTLSDAGLKKALEHEIHAFFKAHYQVILNVDESESYPLPEGESDKDKQPAELNLATESNTATELNLAEATLKVRELIQENKLVSQAITTFEGRVVRYQSRQ